MSGESTSVDGTTIARRRSPLQVAADVWAYFAQQYPPMQAASIGLTAAASYAMYGQVAGHFEFGGHGFAAAALVVVLFLQYRLTDDISTIYNSELGGGTTIPARPTVLIGGLVASLPLEFLLEPDRNALLVAVGALVLMATGSTGLALGKRSAVMRFTARVTFVEIVPLVIFSYVYFAWSGATGRTFSLIAIVAVIGGLIAGFQFWKWSRDLGDEPSERIYFISWPRVRVVLVLLTMLAAGFNALLYSEANLSIAYLIYELAVYAVFAYVVAPRGQADETKPWWAGLGVPVLLQVGLYVQLIALAV
jgi:hypothetical protein